MNLLDPKILLSIKNLQLAARTTIDGFMAGINKSSIKGEGLEFSQYRSYQPGDDLRQLDWKLYARTDRYYIRESEIETSINIRLITDASASMNHEDNGYTKLDYAKYLAASLAWLGAMQGDAIGLYILQSGDILSLDAKKDYQHMQRLYHRLESIHAGGRIDKSIAQNKILSSSAKKELIIFITDLYEQDNELLNVLNNLVMMKHEIIVFHVIGGNELDFDYNGYAALQDWETGEIVKINATQNKTVYQQKINDYLQNIKTNMLSKHFSYRLLNMRQPIEQALYDFLKQRYKQSE